MPPFFRILLLAIVLSACQRGQSYDHVRNLGSQGHVIVCFGNSLTEGVGASRGESYPSLLAGGLDHPVVNAGNRGDTSADGLARLERDVLQEVPRLVIVLFGGNDFLRRIPIQETRKNLEEIVQRIQDQGAMVVLVGMKLGLFTDEYGPLYEEIADRYGALYVPRILEGILSDPKLKSDSIHPNGNGYRIVADRILKHVVPLLKEADRRRSLFP